MIDLTNLLDVWQQLGDYIVGQVLSSHESGHNGRGIEGQEHSQLSRASRMLSEGLKWTTAQVGSSEALRLFTYHTQHCLRMACLTSFLTFLHSCYLIII